MIHVAMTGTRKGMTENQILTFYQQLRILWRTFDSFTLDHGGADGADEVADRAAVNLRIPREIWVPKGKRHKDWVTIVPVTIHYTNKDPLERNWDIIKNASVLLVVPETPLEQLRSGTWACYRYAKKSKIPCWIIEPSGTIKKEDI